MTRYFIFLIPYILLTFLGLTAPRFALAQENHAQELQDLHFRSSDEPTAEDIERRFDEIHQIYSPLFGLMPDSEVYRKAFRAKDILLKDPGVRARKNSILPDSKNSLPEVELVDGYLPQARVESVTLTPIAPIDLSQNKGDIFDVTWLQSQGKPIPAIQAENISYWEHLYNRQFEDWRINDPKGFIDAVKDFNPRHVPRTLSSQVERIVMRGVRVTFFNSHPTLLQMAQLAFYFGAHLPGAQDEVIKFSMGRLVSTASFFEFIKMLADAPGEVFSGTLKSPALHEPFMEKLSALTANLLEIIYFEELTGIPRSVTLQEILHRSLTKREFLRILDPRPTKTDLEFFPVALRERLQKKLTESDRDFLEAVTAVRKKFDLHKPSADDFNQVINASKEFPEYHRYLKSLSCREVVD